METVDKIATVRVGPKTLRSRAPNGQLYPSPNGDVPVENVFIKLVIIVATSVVKNINACSLPTLYILNKFSGAANL